MADSLVEQAGVVVVISARVSAQQRQPASPTSATLVVDVDARGIVGWALRRELVVLPWLRLLKSERDRLDASTLVRDRAGARSNASLGALGWPQTTANVASTAVHAAICALICVRLIKPVLVAGTWQSPKSLPRLPVR